MSTITAYARARAVAAGIAQPVATVRHLHLSDRPMVLLPLTLAGEANAPLAAMVGTAETDPTLLVVAQPRNRDERFAFTAALADVVLPYVDGYGAETEQLKERRRCVDAPQLLVPNPGGVRFVRLLGRSTRFRSAVGPYPVAPRVPLLGRWLTWFAERADHPGSACLLAMTDALTLHWATGQSALEDANLAALMSWIDPPAGSTARRAARLAEDPLVWPPAGPATDPDFDNEVLAPAVAAYDAAEPGTTARRRAHAVLEHALRGQLEPTWRLMWRAVARLRALPAGASVPDRWADDRQRFTDHADHVAGGGLPQARRDGAVAAALRLAWLEQARTRYDEARAFDDPLVMAVHRAAGEAFAGEVVAADRTRRVPNANGTPVTRPLVTVATRDPVHLAPGTRVRAVTRRAQTGVVTAVEPYPGAAVPPATGATGSGATGSGAAGSGATEAVTLVTLEISGGMGRSKVPPAGSVPEPGETLCYTSALAENVPAAPLPRAEETPWTHGGPPQPYLPGEGDAAEVWS